MPIPIVYKKAGEPVVASYDYTDIAEGTGRIIFYAMNENTGGTDNYLLINKELYSNDIYSSEASGTTAASKILDLDFDVIFNMPKRIKGDIIVSIPISTQRGPTYNHYTYAIVKARHWDGTTETELGSATTETVMGSAGAGTYIDALKTVKINIAAIRHFKKGETLRITIELWGWTANAGEARQHAFGHDPKARASATVFPTGVTVTEVNVPFVLDL